MKAIAILTVRNEQRFITQCLTHLHEQGIKTIVVDNQSEDDTLSIVKSFEGNGLIGYEVIPYEGFYDWTKLLIKKEQISMDLDGDWFMHVDADEFHEPVNRNMRLVDLIKEADSEGYNAINFTEYTFFPTQEDPNHNHANFQDTMRWYYAYCPSQHRRVNAWKKQPKVDLVSSGGHRVNFDGLKIYPENQVMRHYICLNKQHAIEKFCKRKFSQDEIDQRGWYGERPYIAEDKISFPKADSMNYWANRTISLDFSQPRTKHFFEAWSSRKKDEAKDAIKPIEADTMLAEKIRTQYRFVDAPQLPKWRFAKPIWWLRHRLQDQWQQLQTRRLCKKMQYYGLIDPHGYLAAYPDVASSKLSPAEHYLRYGWLEGRQMGIKFDPHAYLSANPDVFEQRINPLAHYLEKRSKDIRPMS